MLSIKEMKRTRLPENYYGFSVEDFLNSKTLRIENVKKDRVQGHYCIKVDVRITKDTDGDTDNEGQFTPYNEGKIFTIRYEHDESEDKDMFDILLGELKQSIGYEIEINSDDDVKGIYLHQQNILTIIVSDFETRNSKKEEIQVPKMKDRPLMKLSRYKTFDFDEFIKDNPLTLSGVYANNGQKFAMFNAFIDDENAVTIGVQVNGFDTLPAELLSLNDDFNAIIKDYEFDYISSTNYGTKWTFYFKYLEFKSKDGHESDFIIGDKPEPSETDPSQFSPEQI